MAAKKIGEKIIELEETESTNLYIKNKSFNLDDSGTIVFSHFQTKGKGHQNNVWESEANKNITCSIVLFPDKLKAENQFVLSKMISLAITDYLAIKGVDAKIKWPNDIYVGNKKIAGILIENTIRGEYIDQSIIGIGININQEVFKSNAPNPVSLKIITKQSFNILDELYNLIQFLNHRYQQLIDNKQTVIDKDYKQKLFRIDELTSFKKENKTFTGYIKGVNQFGQLIIETTDKDKRLFNFKEIAFLIL